MKSAQDTIAAIATAPGEAGIAIVRISGPRSLDIADALFRGSGDLPSKRPAGTFVRGYIDGPHIDKAQRHLDEVILLIYRAPHSYTREDVVEIQCHGGRVCAKRILRATVEAGARLAEPGEFTCRAFLSGRIDLIQAEAVADLVRATTDRGASAAIEQLDGSLSSLLTSIYEHLLYSSGDIEASLDFSEEELPSDLLDGASERLRKTAQEIGGMLSTWDEGHLLREGALVVISGRPNAGKSTLLNCLVGRERAIVTDIPGTTRDTIEEQIVLSGIPVRLVDTAGLRDVECRVEKQGVDRALDVMQRADVNLYIVDASNPLHPDDLGHFAQLRPGKAFVLLNKTDLGVLVKPSDCSQFDTVQCCLVRQEGLDEIRAMIISKFGIDTEAPPRAVISERHRQELRSTELNVIDALSLLDGKRDDAVALAASCVHEAIEHIASLTGRRCTNDILDNIFSRFCVGK